MWPFHFFLFGSNFESKSNFGSKKISQSQKKVSFDHNFAKLCKNIVISLISFVKRCPIILPYLTISDLDFQLPGTYYTYLAISCMTWPYLLMQCHSPYLNIYGHILAWISITQLHLVVTFFILAISYLTSEWFCITWPYLLLTWHNLADKTGPYLTTIFHYCIPDYLPTCKPVYLYTHILVYSHTRILT